jgi:hypothetical protein
MKLKTGRHSEVTLGNGTRGAKVLLEPIRTSPTPTEARILHLLKEMDSEDADLLDIQAEIVAMGPAALPALSRLMKTTDEPAALIEMREIYDIIRVAAQKESAQSGDIASSVQGAVAALCDINHDIPEPGRYVDMVVDLGPAAVPELLAIASGGMPMEADCALSLLSEVAMRYPGEEALLDALPLIGRVVDSIAWQEHFGDGRENIYSGFEKAATSLSLLTTLNEQFPGNGQILAILVSLVGKGNTNDPALNRIISETIKEIGGFNPLLAKGDKSKN